MDPCVVLVISLLLAPMQVVSGAGPATDRWTQISGHVVDAAGHGVAGLMIQAIQDNEQHRGRTHAITKDDGAYRLPVRADDNTYDIVVGSERAGFAFLTHVAAGSENVTLTLRPCGIIRVRARTADGRPAEGFVLRGPVGINGARFLELYGIETDAKGVAELGVPAGVVDVEIARGHAITTIRAKVREGKTVEAKVVVQPEPDSSR
jgi:hypothetical protein